LKCVIYFVLVLQEEEEEDEEGVGVGVNTVMDVVFLLFSFQIGR
jgi:hypothetical protein